jgi:hypothetical protein
MGTYYRNAEQFLDKIDKGAWVEIGVERGEGSTRFFAGLAKDRATKFYGVDAMADQIEKATELLKVDGKLPDHIELTHALGEEFLEKLASTIGDDKISLAYLDNFDWDYWLMMQEEPFVAGVKQRYVNEMNIEMTNLNSQRAHLLQAMWLNTMIADNALVICDDTWYHPQEGIFTGKCSGAIPFLLTQGFEILHTEGYRQNSGVILGKFAE